MIWYCILRFMKRYWKRVSRNISWFINMVYRQIRCIEWKKDCLLRQKRLMYYAMFWIVRYRIFWFMTKRVECDSKHRHKNKPAISDKMPMISLFSGLYFSEMDENSVIGYQSRWWALRGCSLWCSLKKRSAKNPPSLSIFVACHESDSRHQLL